MVAPPLAYTALHEQVRSIMPAKTSGPLRLVLHFEGLASLDLRDE